MTGRAGIIIIALLSGIFTGVISGQKSEENNESRIISTRILRADEIFPPDQTCLDLEKNFGIEISIYKKNDSGTLEPNRIGLLSRLSIRFQNSEKNPQRTLYANKIVAKNEHQFYATFPKNLDFFVELDQVYLMIEDYNDLKTHRRYFVYISEAGKLTEFW